MKIKYDTIKNLPNEQLYKLFLAVGWANESTTTQAMIENFNKPFMHSTIVVSAWDGGNLVGCVRVLSDTMFRSVIYDLAVLPQYQGNGIGKELVKKCREYYPNSEWFVETTLEQVGFYEKLGFECNTNPHLSISCELF